MFWLRMPPPGGLLTKLETKHSSGQSPLVSLVVIGVGGSFDLQDIAELVGEFGVRALEKM